MNINAAQNESTGNAGAESRQAAGLVDTEEAARILGVSPRTVQAWVRQKKLPVVKFGVGRGSLTRFRPEALQEWIRGQEINP